MAMTLLDGVSATISVKTQAYDNTGTLTGTAMENACWANTLSLEFRQDVNYIPKITFCTTPGWKNKSVGERDVLVTMGGFQSKGDPSSMPGLGINGQKLAVTAVVDDPTPMTAGADVCSVSLDVFANSDLGAIIAKGNSNRAWQAESTGVVSKAWVIA